MENDKKISRIIKYDKRKMMIDSILLKIIHDLRQTNNWLIEAMKKFIKENE